MPNENDTIYSGSVTDFRRSLTASYAHWYKASAEYGPLEGSRDDGSRAARDAYGASLIAAGCSYALAAVLAVAEREFGHDVAARLALKADDILNNGDDDELNADVMPAEGAP